MGMDLTRVTLFTEDSDMRNRVKGVIKSILFLVILAFVLNYINQILLPKRIYRNSIWPTTSSYNQFYLMEKNTIDVIFLGSSVCVNAFSPQEIYNNCGIRSYNLGSEQQSIFLSYFWLKEALRFQSPQVVVLDTRFLFNLHPENAINTTEPQTRKCLDPMKWSEVKVEAVNDLCSIDKSQTKLSYYLTNIRFHSRWSSLAEEDIVLSETQHAELKGYAAIASYGPQSFAAFKLGDPNKYEGFNPDTLMLEYLDRTVELCEENNIKLMLVSLPGNEINDAIHNSLTRYASDHNVDYINLCEAHHYGAIGAELPRESVIGHENLWGSIKMSQYMGRLLSEAYDVVSVQDPQWEETKGYYEHMIKNCELSHILDFTEYLKAVKDPNYSVFISVGDDAAVGLTNGMKESLKELGMKTDWSDKYRWSYYAVILPGEAVIEESSKDTLTITGGFRANRSVYTITSKGYYTGNSASVIIDGTDYSQNGRGFNIVVYDNVTTKVIDSVRFDTGAAKVTTIR